MHLQVSEEAKKATFDQLQAKIKSTPSCDMLIVMSHMNAKVGNNNANCDDVKSSKQEPDAVTDEWQPVLSIKAESC